MGGDPFPLEQRRPLWPFHGFRGAPFAILEEQCPRLGRLGESRLRFRDRFVHAAWWSSQGVVGVVRPFVVREAYMADSKAWDFSRFRQWHRPSPPQRPQKNKKNPLSRGARLRYVPSPLAISGLGSLGAALARVHEEFHVRIVSPDEWDAGLAVEALLTLVRARRSPDYWPIAAEPYSAR